ncbi:hypothetical protein GCM10009743_65660 [Kribbella swartbergensis]
MAGQPGVEQDYWRPHRNQATQLRIIVILRPLEDYTIYSPVANQVGQVPRRAWHLSEKDANVRMPSGCLYAVEQLSKHGIRHGWDHQRDDFRASKPQRTCALVRHIPEGERGSTDLVRCCCANPSLLISVEDARGYGLGDVRRPSNVEETSHCSPDSTIGSRLDTLTPLLRDDRPVVIVLARDKHHLTMVKAEAGPRPAA